jgi:DMSO reductase family type II enzyme chaperone
MSEAELRSQVYQILGSWLSPPASEVWEDALADGSFCSMHPTGKLLPYALDLKEYQFQSSIQFEKLTQVYSSSFEIGNAAVSFHERTYTRDAPNKLFEELFRFYEHFGLDLKNSDNAHWPDSILVELDFMQYLTHLESIAASEDDVQSLRLGQRDFLKRHLIPLTVGISEKLNALDIKPYNQLSRVINRYLGLDRDHLAQVLNGIISTTNVE